MINSRISEIRSLLSSIESAPVECDGFARLAVTLLHAAGIPYKAFIGSFTDALGRVIPLHVWLEVDGYIIDYRVRMWLGDSAPHGIFGRSGDFHYKGNEITIQPLSPLIFEILKN